ncbi:uncharacterized protein YjbI with pentapeptide repeats [Azospirillum fermentarium]|uniref:pentapeptide repeat-containing protein n=1 Tax=Azospirillum fermentarium TaxID=1233114 RepID=UPI002227D865|nr:pentapeptide repeat-containing protein [Azospirillum fermentarium]MCW2246845.1 uncharacterized protein YjbI with pentapeptide repeats [Azospirillum fermentarium]
MTARSILCALAAAVTLAGAGTARADCADQPQAEVVWRRCTFDGRDLSGAVLDKANVRDSAFVRARLNGASLTDADGYRAKFVSADMTGVKLDRARLIEADFTRATMTGASLRDADLRNAKLTGADLSGADLTGARLSGSDFRHANVSGATWTDGKTVCGENSVGQCN